VTGIRAKWRGRESWCEHAWAALKTQHGFDMVAHAARSATSLQQRLNQFAWRQHAETTENSCTRF
jgi:hypothetical protein